MAVPKIRIKGYTDEWKKPFIEEVFEVRNGYTPSKFVSEFWTNGTIPWFRMEDIRDKGGILKEAYQQITPIAVKGTGLFNAYSIIMATTATIGIHAMPIVDSLANQQFTNFSIRKSLENQYDPFFIYYSFFQLDDWAKKNVNSGGLLSVDIKGLLKQPLYSPDIKIQKQIAEYFQSLDSLIEATDKKIATLKQTKQASLQSMFPQEGETKPRVRFKGFADEWEKTELSEITTIKKGEQINKSELTNDGKYYVLNGGMLPSGYTNEYNTLENTISISEGGNSCGFVFFNEQKFWSGGHNYTLQNVKIHSYFLFAYLKGIEDFIMSKRVGSGLPNIQKSALAEISVFYPTNSIEQEKVAEYFSNLDKQISIQEQRLEKLKQIKSACLKNMFV